MKYEKEALKKFSSAIRMGLDKRKMSIRELSKRSGVSRTIIYKVLNAENYEIRVFIKLCRVLQIHIEFSLMSAGNNIHTMGGDKPEMNYKQ